MIRADVAPHAVLPADDLQAQNSLPPLLLWYETLVLLFLLLDSLTELRQQLVQKVAVNPSAHDALFQPVPVPQRPPVRELRIWYLTR